MASPSPLDPKGAAGKLKPQLQLIPPALNAETAKALSHGNDKYGPWNWRTARVEIMTYLGAMKRHIDAVLNREDFDPASGAHHLGHVAASCGIVLDAAENGTLVDNRPPRSSCTVMLVTQAMIDRAVPPLPENGALPDGRAIPDPDAEMERIRNIYPGYNQNVAEMAKGQEFPRMMSVADLPEPTLPGYTPLVKGQVISTDPGSLCSAYPGMLSSEWGKASVSSTPPAFKRPADGMTLKSIMECVRQTTKYTEVQLAVMESALAPLFEPNTIQ